MAQPEHALGYIRIIKEQYACDQGYRRTDFLSTPICTQTLVHISRGSIYLADSHIRPGCIGEQGVTNGRGGLPGCLDHTIGASARRADHNLLRQG